MFIRNAKPSGKRYSDTQNVETLTKIRKLKHQKIFANAQQHTTEQLIWPWIQFNRHFTQLQLSQPDGFDSVNIFLKNSHSPQVSPKNKERIQKLYLSNQSIQWQGAVATQELSSKSKRQERSCTQYKFQRSKCMNVMTKAREVPHNQPQIHKHMVSDEARTISKLPL